MEWSGNFSKEEYLAFAQDISDEDMPGFVTLESFKYASTAGSTSLAQGFPSFLRKRRDENSTLVRGTGASNHGDGGDECYGSPRVDSYFYLTAAEEDRCEQTGTHGGGRGVGRRAQSDLAAS